MKAHLAEWQKDAEQLQEKIRKEGADKQQELKAFVESIQSKIEEGKRKLASLEDSADDDWEPLKGSVESWLDMTRSAFGDTKDKFKE